jgi:hypothetical protein
VLHPTSIPPAKNPSKSPTLAIRLVHQVIYMLSIKFTIYPEMGIKGMKKVYRGKVGHSMQVSFGPNLWSHGCSEQSSSQQVKKMGLLTLDSSSYSLHQTSTSASMGVVALPSCKYM